MKDHQKLNICHAVLAIFCLLNIKGFVDAANEPTCYECKDNITDPLNTVPKCNRIQTKCPNNKTTCGVITYQQPTGAVTYDERCLSDLICANTSNCGTLVNCYIECCSGDLCNNYTSTNVSQNMPKPKAPTPTKTPTPTKALSANLATSATPTKAPSADLAPSATPTKAPSAKAPLATPTPTPTKAPMTTPVAATRPTCANDTSYLSMNPLLLLCILALCFKTLCKD